MREKKEKSFVHKTKRGWKAFSLVRSLPQTEGFLYGQEEEEEG